MCDDKNCSLKRAIAGGPSLVPVSGSNIHNIKKRNNHKYADTCLVAIAVHLCKMFCIGMGRKLHMWLFFLGENIHRQ